MTAGILTGRKVSASLFRNNRLPGAYLVAKLNREAAMAS